MVGEIFAGIGAFNAMLGAAKALRDMDNTASRNAAVIELQGQILAAQEDYAALLAKVRGLEDKLAQFEDWETKKKRYELKGHGVNNIPAYALRDGVDPPEFPHSICPDCYEQRKRSIVLPENRYQQGSRHSLSCNACGWRGWIYGEAMSLGDKRR